MSRPGLRSLWILVLWLAAAGGVGAQDRPDALVEPAGGTYGDAVTVTATPIDAVEYRFLSPDGTPHTDFWLPLDEGIYLDAPSDSQAIYEIAVRRSTNELDTEPSTAHRYRYTIDRMAPGHPRVSPAPGLHTAPITMLPAADAGDQAAVYYRLLHQDGNAFRRLPTEGVTLTAEPGAVRDYRVALYAVDAAGNRGPVGTVRYRIDRSNAGPAPETVVVSPRPGRYSNQQLIYADTRGFTEVSAQLRGPDGNARTVAVDGSETAVGAGTFQLTITAHRGETTIEETVEWTQGTEESLDAGGRRNEPVRLAPPEEATRFVVGDRPVRPSDPLWLEPLRFEPSPDEFRTVVLRSRPSGAADDARAVFLLDGRRAPAADLVVRESGEVHVFALAATQLEWSPAGEPEDFVAVADGRIPREALPANVESIVVRSRFPGGPWTRTVLAVPPANEAAPTPTVTATDEVVTVTGTENNTVTLVGAGGETLFSTDATDGVSWFPPFGYRQELSIDGPGVDPGGDEAVLARNVPPAPPTVTVRENRITLSGDGDVFYRIDGAADQPYRRPVTLSGVPEARRRYRFETYQIVAGEVSPVRVERIVVDRREPVPPTTPSILRSNEPVVEVPLTSPFDDQVFHYEVTSRGQPLLPTVNSPSTRSMITIEAPPEATTTWRIAVRARFLGGSEWSRLHRFQVITDRVPPDPPVLQEDLLAEGVVSFEPPSESDVTLRYRLGAAAPFRDYVAPVSVDRAALREPVTVEAIARDAAGNETAATQSWRIAPATGIPRPRITVNGRVAPGPVVQVEREPLVGVQAIDGGSIQWRIVPENGTAPAFAPYDADLPLPPGRSTVEAFAAGPEGERSSLSRLVVRVGEARLAAPEPPFIAYDADGRSGTATWPGSGAASLFVSVTADGRESDSFVPRQGSMQWSIPDGLEEIVLSYFFVDGAGTRSDTRSTVVSARRSSAAPALEGVRDGGVYRTARTLRFGGDATVRFTLSSDGSAPPPVSATSRAAVEPLTLGAAVGEERQFRIRYRAFDGDRPQSREGQVSFVVDRRPPDAPRLAGVEPEGYYAADRTATLETPAGTRTLYRLIRLGAPEPEFREFDGSGISLTADPAEPVVYRIEAYAVDSAGNRSQRLSRWTVTIDATSVHVRSGSAGGDGSRDAPFATVEEALRAVIDNGVETIFLAGGTYRSGPDLWSEVLGSGRPVALIGGLDGATWTEGSEPTEFVIRRGDPIPVRSGMVLRGLRLRQPVSVEGEPSPSEQPVVLRQLFSTVQGEAGLVVSGGTVSVRQASFLGDIDIRAAESVQMVQSTAGTLYGRDATIAVEGGALTGLRLGSGARGAVSGTRIEGDGTRGIDGTVYAEAANLSLERVLITDQGASDTVLLRVRGGRAEIRDSVLLAQAGQSTVVVRTQDGALTVTDSVLSSQSQGYAYGIAGRRTDTTVTGSALRTRGLLEAVSITARGGRTVVRDGLIWTASTDPTGAATAVSVDGDETTLMELDATGFFAAAPGEHRAPGTAVRIAPAVGASLRNNRFVEWTTLFERTGRTTSWTSAGRVSTADALNRIDGARGNRVIPSEQAAIPFAAPPAVQVPRRRGAEPIEALQLLRASIAPVFAAD